MNKATIDRIQASKQKEGGFTLIELLIVIVILGILAGVVIFASGGFQNKGAVEACKTTVSTVKTASEAFHVDSPTAAYPAAWADIDPTYFDANGVSYDPATKIVQGKGWKFKYTFVALGAGAPTPSSGGGAAFSPADSNCTK